MSSLGYATSLSLGSCRLPGSGSIIYVHIAGQMSGRREQTSDLLLQTSLEVGYDGGR